MSSSPDLPRPGTTHAVRWLTAFLDTPDERSRSVESFWVGVTGYRLSPRRGLCDEFASLLPDVGDPHLCLQRVGHPVPGGMHLDLHTDDSPGLVARAETLGATTIVADVGYVVCRSPGGLRFCVVSHPSARPSPPVRWPGGRSLVDQVCFDIPPSRWDSECEFWSELTGWALDDHDETDEFRRLGQAPGLALQILLRRLDDEQPVVTAHLDLACDDVEAEVERHRRLGAVEVRRTRRWTTLRDPGGRHYCVTGRPLRP
jgi:predicted enzyme related to lactoylglutathione lyase